MYEHSRYPSFNGIATFLLWLCVYIYMYIWGELDPFGESAAQVAGRLPDEF